MKKSFSNNRRLKSIFFLSSCVFVSLWPHFSKNRPPFIFLLIISFIVLFYGGWVILRNLRGSLIKAFTKYDFKGNFPPLDILVAARDEQNVIARLVERLFNLDYPSDKLNIYIIDDGSIDGTSQILKDLSGKYEKLQIISRSKNAGGGKSGALNDALRFSSGEWIFILDADAQLKNDTLMRLLNFAYSGSWPAVQLRKSVINANQNLLTKCQSIEMAMDAFFQLGRLTAAGVSELRGNGQLIKKDVLIGSGSFNEDTVTDDLDLSIRLLLSDSKIGILWNPPVMEEAVENIPALFAQRQRWAEGGLQRFFDYGSELIFGKLNIVEKFDLFYFFILQYALPIISLLDLCFSLVLFKSPVYWPISITAFMLSAVASWYGSNRTQDGAISPKTNLLNLLIYLAYLSHWFLVIPFVTFKMSIFPKKILWKKTIHKG